jgi:ABC-2 type transport system permease protein
MAVITAPATEIRGRQGGFFNDIAAVALRAVRLTLREPEAIIPAIIIPVFFFAVNIGALQEFTEGAMPGFDFKAFQLPVAIIFAVTGISRASSLVIDIQSGYFDRLLLTPVKRGTLLLGLMVADLALVMALSAGVVLMGLAVGVRFETELLGIALFILLGGLWGIAFTGFPYAIALKTGNPAAVNVSFILFFPFAFLTSAFVPQEALTGWLDTAATYNPVTYLLDGMRSLVTDGWRWGDIGGALAAILGVGVVSFSLAFVALRGRVKRG